MHVIFLPLAAFLAGLVDAIAGGGGLLQLPALLLGLPNAETVAVLGTNKGSSIAGTGFAVARYGRSVAVPFRLVGPSALVAFAGSMLGARLADFLRPDTLRPAVIVLLALVLVHTARSPALGAEAKPVPHERALPRALAIGLGLGIYDGFFGPGTGSFLLFLFVSTLGFDFLTASASAKVVNLATNLAAVLVFAQRSAILWEVALPMAACNVLGSVVGTRLAIERGAPLVRKVFLVVASALWLKLAWDLVRAHV